MPFKRLIVVSLGALSLACGDDRPALTVGADAPSYQMQSVPSTGFGLATVSYRSWNHGSATAFVRSCGARPIAVLERLVDGSWQPYTSALCIALEPESPIQLRAGESRRDQLIVGAPGHFRIRLPYAADAGAGDDFNALSREFDVHQ